MTASSPFRTGDKILHKPTGETWVCAWADPESGYLSWLGWPPGEAKISDFDLAKAASDEEHRDRLRDLKQSARPDVARALRLYGDPDAAPAAPPVQTIITEDFASEMLIVLRNRVRELERALEPFANAANFWEIESQKDEAAQLLVKPGEGFASALTVKNFREAQRVIRREGKR
jgi:hypothetical protein